MDGESEAEFDEDFGYALQPKELEDLLARARRDGDRDVRLLVKQHQGLRRVAADVLAWIEERHPDARPVPRQPGEPFTYPVGFLQWILRDEPRTPQI